MATENYNEMTLVNLKEIAKEKGIKNISKLKKSELIEELVKITPNKVKIALNKGVKSIFSSNNPNQPPFGLIIHIFLNKVKKRRE